MDRNGIGASRGIPAPPRGAARVGLGRVFGLAEATGERIVSERADRPFRSLADFVERARPAAAETESLILAGALDWTRRSRPSLLLEARAGARAWARAAPRARAQVPLGDPRGNLEGEARPPVAVPDIEEFDLAERVRGEWRATGLWFAAHPLAAFVPASARDGACDAEALPRLAGRRVALLGLPCASRRVQTRGGSMLFLTIADPSGLAECVLFPDVYRAHPRAARGRIVRVEGRVDETLGSITLVADGVSAVARAGG